jgi:hypothetical protein
MSAQKKVKLDAEMKMVPACHPESQVMVLYRPARGGDDILIKCSQCYRIFFQVKLPREDA